MTGVLHAGAHATGRRIDLRFDVKRPVPAFSNPERPALRLVRRRLGFPANAEDGLTVADLTELFATATEPWERVERIQFRTVNTGSGDPTIEADITLYFDAPQPSEPVFARLRFFDDATQSYVEDLVEEASLIVRSSPIVGGWEHSVGLELFHTPGGGPQTGAGFLAFYFRHDDPVANPNHVDWAPMIGPLRRVKYDTYAHWKVDRTEASVLTFETRAAVTPDDEPGLTWLTLSAASDEDAGTALWSLTVRDRDVEPGVHYYYMVFDLDAAEPLGMAVALATEDHGSPERLFLRLPGAYQRADEPDPSRPTGAAGPMRRLLEPIGHGVDLARSIADSTVRRHDVHTARTDLLPHLARMIGWTPDVTAPAETQRRDILSAPEVFGSVGTIPNVRALVNRATRWPCRVKEFVNNVFLTNAPESIRLWELWEVRNDGTQWTPQTQCTLTRDIDARPALAVDGGGVVWLFWHSDRGGSREVWRQRLDGIDAGPVRARTGASDDTAEFSAVDDNPATVWDGAQVWLFWSSNREGQWDIWARTFDGAANAGDPMRLTDHSADDRSPAAALVPGTPDRLWLFWSSRRRGPADIWSRVLDLSSGVWSDAERLTTSPLRDDRPAATVDATGRLWLFWTRDAGGRQTIWCREHDGTAWGAETALDAGHARDEAPTAAPWNGGVFLLWHSNHNGPWQIWGRTHDGTAWAAAARLSRSVLGNKEPAAAIDSSGDLRVVWRSQRRARRYRSRTLDVTDIDMLEAMGTADDYVHYTYDTGVGDNDWYARESVGLFLDTSGTSAPLATLDRVKRFVEPFRPVPVVFRWVPDPPAHTEVLNPDVTSGDEWDDETA